jgi:hypothetical protein
MTKSATDVMHDIVTAAVLDAITALKAASKGVPNQLLRDLNAIHANTTFADLPDELRAAIGTSVRAAFTRLQKEGYSVSSATAPPPRAPEIRPDTRREPRRGDRPPSSDRPGRPPRQGPKPGGPPRGPGRRDR